MTRKDYVLIAAAISDVLQRYAAEDNVEAMEPVRRVRDCIASALAEENSRFDGQRFVAATEKGASL